MAHLKYTPNVESVSFFDELPLGPKHTALLYDEVVSAGLIEYAFLVVIVENGSDDPILFITSEVNATATKAAKNSHFLCIFDERGHGNHGASDDWGDEVIFFAEALSVAARILGVKEGPPPLDFL